MRRPFSLLLSVCGIASSGKVNSTRTLSSTSCGQPKTAEVTVVGGGLAGIFAASVLELKGISYNLLEYTGQLGGRLCSFESNFELKGEKIILEEAANFMYGKSKDEFRENPVWRLFRNYAISSYEFDFDDWDTYNKHGARIRNSKVRQVQKKFKRASERCLDESGNEWFDEFMQGFQTPDEDAESVLRNCRRPWTADTRLKAAAAHLYVEQLNNALPLNRLSRATFPEDSYAAFGDTVFFQFDQYGSSAMINQLAKDKLDPNSIHLNAEVTKVYFSDDKEKATANAVHVVDGCTQKYKSDYVIVTVPMNILKGDQIQFIPPLENIDEHPINQVKAEKVWIQFSEIFWDPTSQWVVLANELSGGVATFFFSYELALPGSNLLLTFVGEDQLVDLGGTIDDAAVDKLIRDLKKIPGWKDNITYEYEATNWSNKPSFGGAWESWELGRTYQAFKRGILPQGKLHKAGSGHCQNFWGFTWAAIFSGIWNAEWIANRMENPSTDPLLLAPYTPCEDVDNIKSSEMKDFYLKFGSLFAP